VSHARPFNPPLEEMREKKKVKRGDPNIASMHIGSEKNILGFGSPQLACVGVKPAALHVVRVVFERFGLMVHPRNHQRMLVEAVVSTDEHANVLSIHDCSRYTRHRRRGMPNN
jgi:hypothetical protein